MNPSASTKPKPQLLDLRKIKHEIRLGAKACEERFLDSSFKWLSELNYSLRDVKIGTPSVPWTSFSDDDEAEFDKLFQAQGYFKQKEFDRCSYYTKPSRSRLGRFLYYYSRYMSCEKKKIGEMIEATVTFDTPQLKMLRDLVFDLRAESVKIGLDGYSLYVLGVVLKKLELFTQAEEVLRTALKSSPTHWGAWLELASLVTSRHKLETMNLPDHWMKSFFIGYVFLELQLYNEASEVFQQLQQQGFVKSNYVFVQMAMIYHNKREVDKAIDLFEQLQLSDPCRLDNLDTYSNLLYVKERRVELAHLAHRATEIDKFRVETCCIIGNYYSLRSEHPKAVIYFQRALKLNPLYLSAWTLMGHEFMEMKNTNAAIQSYRQAIEVNRRDYRAWYGLGQTYEILKMLFYCLYYYKQAQMLRPNDSRMLVALGETYEKLDRTRDAHKCYQQARGVGDVEATALLKLSKLYEKLNDDDRAAAAYAEYVNEIEIRQMGDTCEHSSAYRYLANYYVKRNLDLAYSYAQQCLEYEETKEEGKALLRTISQKRSQRESVDQMLLEEGFSPPLNHMTDSNSQLSNLSPSTDTSGGPMNLSLSLSTSTSSPE